MKVSILAKMLILDYQGFSLIISSAWWKPFRRKHQRQNLLNC